MRLLKSALCLAMLGAGIAAVPSQLAGAAAPPAAADDSSIVSQMTDEAQGSVVTTAEESTGKVGFVRAKGAGADLMPGVAADDKASAAAKADAYLAKYSAAFGAAKGQLQREGVQANDLGWTVNYTQTYKGLPVFGSLLRAHLDAQGDLTAVNGFAAPGLTLSTDARRSAAEAGERAVAFVKSSPAEGANGGAKATGLKAGSTHLVVYRIGSTKGTRGANTLAYVVEVVGDSVRDKVFVDANSGKVLNRYSMIDNALDRKLYEADPDSTPVWEEGDPFPGTLTTDQQNLVLGTGESYWFFKNAFNRDSYDDGGATMRTVNNDPTINCPNANWNGQTTNYCNGVTSDDVVAHEWGHAYTEFTWGGIYQWQSGALNESYSDIWGETVDLINDRMDDDEGDTNAKRADGACSENTVPRPVLVINSPAAIARVCSAAGAAFGPPVVDPGMSGNVVLGLDPVEAGGTDNDGCSALTNAAAVAGKIAMVNRGTCGFAVKVKNAQNAGAIAVVVGQNNPFAPSGMSGADPTITIPSLMISRTNRNAIADQLAAGATVNVSLQEDPAVREDSYRWLIGEDATAFGSAIRDMWSPTCLNDPGKVSDAEYHCDVTDGGGVHSNSGVPNHGYALLVDGGSFNGQTVTGIRLTKAAHIYYRAMTEYQTPVSDFVDHADSLEASCTDLINKQLRNLSTDENDVSTHFNKITAADCAEVADMVAAVELRTEPVQCDFGPQLDPNTPAVCGAGMGSSTSFEDDFESGIGDWTLTNESVFGGPVFDWESTTELPPGNKPAGSDMAAFGPAGDGGSCSSDEDDFSQAAYMTSPEITVGETGDVGPRLAFDHNIQTELGFDGGTVMVSVEGGPFETVPASAYVFNEPTVLATEAAGNTNPLEGQDGFTGTDGGKIVSDWGTSIIDLEDLGVAIGDTIQVQFAIGRDGCGGVVGWYVDNVRVVTCYDLATSTISAAHVPNPSTYGQNHSVDVTVGGAEGTPTGTVTVKTGTTTLGTAPVGAGGLASIPLDRLLPAGTYNLAASYSGDSTYDTSMTNFTATVQKATGTIAAEAKPKKVKKGKTFRTKVEVTLPNGLKPVGTVTIVRKGKVLGEGTLDANGKVTIRLKANFKPGTTVTLKAVYAATANTTELIATYDLKMAKK